MHHVLVNIVCFFDDLFGSADTNRSASELGLNCCQATHKHTNKINGTEHRQRSDTCIVRSPSAVILYISTHGMPLVQSNDLVANYRCVRK